MRNKIRSRFNDDTAESLTISQILWIVFTVVLVLFVGGLIYKAVSSKGEAIANCLDNSNTLFQTTDKNPDCAKTSK